MNFSFVFLFIKQSKECLIRSVSKHLKVGFKKTRLHLMFFKPLLVFGNRMKHSRVLYNYVYLLITFIHRSGGKPTFTDTEVINDFSIHQTVCYSAKIRHFVCEKLAKILAPETTGLPGREQQIPSRV